MHHCAVWVQIITVLNGMMCHHMNVVQCINKVHHLPLPDEKKKDEMGLVRIPLEKGMYFIFLL